MLCLDPWLELNSADSGTLGERRRASHYEDLLDSTTSTLCAVHLRVMRTADLGTGLTVRRAKQSISRTATVLCACWRCEARVHTSDSCFGPRGVRLRVHVSNGPAVLLLSLATSPSNKSIVHVTTMESYYLVPFGSELSALSNESIDFLASRVTDISTFTFLRHRPGGHEG